MTEMFCTQGLSQQARLPPSQLTWLGQRLGRRLGQGNGWGWWGRPREPGITRTLRGLSMERSPYLYPLPTKP